MSRWPVRAAVVTALAAAAVVAPSTGDLAPSRPPAAPAGQATASLSRSLATWLVQAPPPAGQPPGVPGRPAPRPGPARAAPGPHVPFDPSREPAIRGDEELRKGAEGLRSGDNPFPEFIKPVGPGVFELGTITLDLNAKRATVPGRINMSRGIIEYLAVMDRRGKLHESVLALDVQPSHLQLALILLGLDPAEWIPGDAATRTPPRLAKPGDPVALWVEWSRDGRPRRVPAEALVWNRETQRPLEGNQWLFTGSFFGRRGFAADVTGSVVATWTDYRAILNASAQAQNPYRGPSAGYEVNWRAVPPLNTPIRLVLEPALREKRPEPGKDSGG